MHVVDDVAMSSTVQAAVIDQFDYLGVRSILLVIDVISD